MLLQSNALLAFVGVSAILTLTPGPGVIYLVTRTLGQGRQAGLASVIGVAVGNFGNAALSSLGLAVLIAASPIAFWLIKGLGAAYLIFLGVRSLFAPTEPVSAGPPPNVSNRHFRDGVLVALLNPKTALFFAAILPQFIQTRSAVLNQTFLLACVFITVALCTDTLYVFTAAAVAPAFQRNPGSRRFGRRVSAVTYCGLGLYAALSSAGAPPKPSP